MRFIKSLPPTDDCESQPCEHGGRCKDQLGGFLCDCSGTGFTGDYCENNIDECSSSPCENGGECNDKINDYQVRLTVLEKIINTCDIYVS